MSDSSKLVEIMRLESEDPDSGLTRRVKVLVDGAEIGGGLFGGEPEDNYEFRHYAWVIPLLKRLAISVGANVVETTREDPEE